mmetsp:Transcript_1345/g.4643  ORF Transcript_1345/g.4643 Transcript_1345/m.4643 type:complete len:761 (+) Transcript_1345:4775-7057(+)
MGCGLSKQQFLLPQPIGLEHSRNAILSLIPPENHNLAMQLFVRYDLENRIQLEEEFEGGTKKRRAGTPLMRHGEYPASSRHTATLQPDGDSTTSDTHFMGFEWSNTLLKELQTDHYKKDLQNMKLGDVKYNERTPTSGRSTGDSSTGTTPHYSKNRSGSSPNATANAFMRDSPSRRTARVNSTSSLRNNFMVAENESWRHQSPSNSSAAVTEVQEKPSSRSHRSVSDVPRRAQTPVTPILSPVSTSSLNGNKISVILAIDMATSRWYGAFYFQDKTHVVKDSDMISSQLAGKRSMKYDPGRFFSRSTTTLDLAEMARVSFEDLQTAETLGTSSPLSFHKVDILGKMFSKMKSLAIKKLSEFIVSDSNIDISNVVVTIPSSIGSEQREKLGAACQKAGMHLIRVVTGSTATALHVGHHIPSDHKSHILVYNHGYSVADVCILKVHFGIFEMLASVGDGTLGGKAFTSNLAAYLREQYTKTFSTSLPVDETQDKLLQQAEIIKKKLSTETSTSVFLENLFENDFEVDISRAKFETINKSLFDQCQKLLIQALADAKLDRTDITHVITVGSTTKMHGISQLLQRDFQKHLIEHKKHEVVVQGAALQAANCQQDLQTHSSTTGISFVMVDIYPYCVNIELCDGLCIELIPALSSVPCKATKAFTTVVDGQKGIHIKLFEHSTLQKRDDQILAGEFKFNGIPSGVPKTKAIIEVTVGIKENLEMRVFAVCKYGSTRTKLHRLKSTDTEWKIRYPLPEFAFQKPSK